MKTSIKRRVLCLLCLLVFSFSIAKGQEIIEHNGDTLITITPSNLKTINCIIVDFENTKDQLNNYKNLAFQDSILINQQDSMIAVQTKLMNKKENYYIKNATQLQESLKKEKKKKNWLGGILGTIAAVFGVIAICK